MDSTEPSAEALTIADKILEEMRGGPILAVGPARSRIILAQWVERLVMANPVDEETAGAVLIEREACAALCDNAATDMTARIPVEGGAAASWLAEQIRARK